VVELYLVLGIVVKVVGTSVVMPTLVLAMVVMVFEAFDS
jgi:hypothetical protein